MDAVDSASDARTVNNTVRHKYRVLSDDEKATMEDIDERLKHIVEKFRDKYDIHCPETIYQMDKVIENAYEFIEELMDVVGYAE